MSNSAFSPPGSSDLTQTRNGKKSINKSGDDYQMLSDANSTNGKQGKCCCGYLSYMGCLGVFIVVMGVFILGAMLGYFLLLPNMAQGLVNDATLTMSRVVISQPNLTQFHTYVEGEMSSAGPFNAHIDDLPLTVSYEGKTLGHLTLPGLDIKGNSATELKTNVEFYISNQSNFDVFAGDLMRKHELTWNLKGKLALKPSVFGISVKVPTLEFDKDVTLKGLDGLTGIQIVSADLTRSNATNIIVGLEAFVTNPSSSALDPSGNLTFDVFYQGLRVGYVVSDDVNMEQGKNQLNLTNYFEIDSSLLTDPRVQELFSRAMTNKPVTLSLEGVSSSIPLFSKALKGLKVESSLTVLTPPLVQSMKAESASLKFFPNDMGHMQVDMDASITINNPLGPNSPIIVRQVNAVEFTLQDKNGRAIGVGRTGIVPVIDGDKPTIRVTLSALLKITDKNALSEFAADWTSSKFTIAKMVGTLNTTVHTALGDIAVYGIPINNEVTLQGLNNFQGLNLDVTGVNINGGGADGIHALTSMNINGVSNVGIELGEHSNLHLHMMYEGVVVADAIVDSFKLHQGLNLAEAKIVINSADTKLQRKFISNYLNGVDCHVTVASAYPASIYPFMEKALSKMISQTVLKGQHDKLLHSSSMRAEHVELLKSIIPTTLVVFNSFNVDVELVETHTPVLLTSSMTQIARLDQDLRNKPIKLVSQKEITTYALPFHYSLSWATFVATFKGLGGVDLTMRGGNITVRFGGVYEQVVDYNQSGVITYLR